MVVVIVVEMVIIEEGESTVVIVVVRVVEEEEGGGDNNNNVGRHVDEIIEIHLPRYYHPVHHQEILQIMIQEDVIVRYFCPAQKWTLSKRNINEQKVHKLPRTDSLNDLLVDHPTILVESKSSFKGVVLLEESVKYLSKY